MPTVRIPFVGSLTNRNIDPTTSGVGKDQFFQNCFPEVYKNPLTGAGAYFLNKRPSFETPTSIANFISGSYGACIWTSYSGSPSPTMLSLVKTGAVTIGVFDAAGTQYGGDIASTHHCFALTDTVVGTTGNLVGVFSDSTTDALEGWFLPEGGAWTQITDGDFPPNLGTPEPLTLCAPAHMDGYAFWMTKNGKIWNSDLNSVSAYTANSYITDSSYPDGGVGIARYKNLIFALGTKSGSFYQNTGNATGSPLSLIPSATMRIGCIPAQIARTIMPVADTVYWIGTNADTGSKGVFRLNGYSPEKVSNNYVDKLLARANITGFAGSFNMLGMSHIAMFNNVSGGTVPCFCIDTGFWWLLNFPASLTLAARVMIGNPSYTFNSGFSYFVSDSTNKIYRSGSDISYKDDSVAYTETVQTENIDFGTMNRKFFERVRPYGFDVQSATSTLTIEYSDDDYATWTTWGTIDLSSAAQINRGLTRGGGARRRAFRISHASGTPCRGQGIEIDYTKGTS